MLILHRYYRTRLVSLAMMGVIIFLGACGVPSAPMDGAGDGVTMEDDVPAMVDDGATMGDDVPTIEDDVLPAEVDSTSVYRRITAAEAREIMDNVEAYILLDVRSEDEYQAGHIAGAILIPHTELDEQAADMLPDKNAIILIYCQAGRRSQIAALALVELGYVNVYDTGGIGDWRE
jgi:rhodanese-related sulfurtransferase